MSSKSELSPQSTMERRREIMNACAGCTLNGEPALVSGYLQPFAMVRQRAAPHFGCEFAWSTVARIIASGGGFKA